MDRRGDASNRSLISSLYIAPAFVWLSIIIITITIIVIIIILTTYTYHYRYYHYIDMILQHYIDRMYRGLSRFTRGYSPRIRHDRDVSAK